MPELEKKYPITPIKETAFSKSMSLSKNLPPVERKSKFDLPKLQYSFSSPTTTASTKLSPLAVGPSGTYTPKELINQPVSVGLGLSGGFGYQDPKTTLGASYSLNTPQIDISKSGVSKGAKGSASLSLSGSRTFGKKGQWTGSGDVSVGTGQKPSATAGLTYSFSGGGEVNQQD